MAMPFPVTMVVICPVKEPIDRISRPLVASTRRAYVPVGYLDRGSSFPLDAFSGHFCPVVIFAQSSIMLVIFQPSRFFPAAMLFRTTFFVSFAMPRLYAHTLE
jgi:hypothetical protein